jgi:hypothetical protein
MMVEVHWKILKYHFLQFLTRPRLDRTVYIICKEAVPTFCVRATELEQDWRKGRGKILTRFQRAFKSSWNDKLSKPLGSSNRLDHEYKTDLISFTCDCGAQEMDAFHLCKHLVHAASPVPGSFFTEIVRRRTLPLYAHRLLQPDLCLPEDDNVHPAKRPWIEDGTTKSPVSDAVGAAEGREELEALAALLEVEDERAAEVS